MHFRLASERVLAASPSPLARRMRDRAAAAFLRPAAFTPLGLGAPYLSGDVIGGHDARAAKMRAAKIRPLRAGAASRLYGRARPELRADGRDRARCASVGNGIVIRIPAALTFDDGKRGGEAAIRRDSAGNSRGGEEPRSRPMSTSSRHTDLSGTPQVNQALSDKRAAAVATYLAGHGVSKARIASKGLGETAPLYNPGYDDTQRAANRRVEIRAGTLLRLTPLGEKVTQKRQPLSPRRSRRAHRGDGGRSAARRSAAPWTTPAALRILGAEAQRLDPRERNRGSAHRAGLEGHPQGALVEPRGPEPRRSGADRHHLGMGGRIGRSAHRVARLGDDLIAAGDDRANRHLAGIGCLRRARSSARRIGEGSGKAIARPASRAARREVTSRCWSLRPPDSGPAFRPPASAPSPSSAWSRPSPSRFRHRRPASVRPWRSRRCPSPRFAEPWRRGSG